MLGQLGRKLRRLEDDIFEGGRSSEIVRELSNVKQEIINFRAVIRPQRAVFRALERAKQRYLTDDLDIYFDDLTDASERIWDVLENFKEIVEGLESSNESVLSHRLNDGLRVLTAVSVILLPLTLLASVFGMNVHFPGEGSPVAFWLILARDAARADRDDRLLPEPGLALGAQPERRRQLDPLQELWPIGADPVDRRAHGPDADRPIGSGARVTA